MLSLLLRNQLSTVCFYKGCVFFHFGASRAVFWSLSGYKEIKHTTKPFTGPALGGVLISLGICRKQIVDGFNSETAVLTISFRLLSSPLLSLFLARFSFAGPFHCSRVHFGGKRFWRNF